MAKSANQKILDSVYSRAVDLSRFEEQEKQAVLEMLEDIQSKVRQDLVNIKLDPTIPKTLRGKEARLKALQKQINATINTGTSKIKRHTNKSLEQLAINEGAFSESIILNAVPAEIATAINTVAVSPALLKEMATNTYIDGYTNTEWWSSIGNDLKHSFKRSVREGIARGEGIGPLVSRVTSATAGNVGFKAFEAHAKTLVRTSVSTVSNRAREAVWDANSDIISNLKWVSTLDSRTSDVCIARDNKLYTNPDHKPIGHSYPWESGPGSLHWNCRSTSIGVLKDADALGIDDTGKTRKARNTLDGKVPKDTNYETWLKGQPVKVQNKVLGKTKAELWRNGQVKSFRDLVDQTGRAKPLSELPSLKKPKVIPKTIIKPKIDKVPTIIKKQKFDDLTIPKQRKIKLSADEKASINYYTGDGFRDINKNLNSGNFSRVEGLTNHIDKGLNKLPDYKGNVTRTVTFNSKKELDVFLKSHKVNSPVRYDQYLSTSNTGTYGGDIAGPDRVKISINSKTGKDISGFSRNKTEGEVLFGRGSQFKVNEVKVGAGKYGETFITMEEI